MTALSRRIRAGLYTALLLFSLTLFILCAISLSASFGRNNGGIIELFCATLLTLVWCIMILCTYFLRRFKDGFPLFYWEELLGLIILWALWLGGAIAATVSSSSGCRWYHLCEVHITILVFAWMGTVVLMAMVILSAKGMLQSIHGWHRILEERLPNRDEGRVMLPPDEESPIIQG